MIHRLSLVVALSFIATGPLEAWPVDPQVSCSADLTYNYGTLTSRGAAWYYDNWGNPAQATLSGFHWIEGSDGSTPAGETVNTTTGSWAGTISGTITPPTLVRVCYQGLTEASAPDTQIQRVGSGRICFDPPPPPPPPPPPGPTLTECPTSPIIFNLSGGGYELSGIDDPVLFDLDADGISEVVAWTALGAEMGFLALDRNGNEQIDGGGELFGDHTALFDGAVARNGFEALAEFDTNADGVIDSADAIWQRLLIWTDRNHDGLSSVDELEPIAATGITAIDLAYHLAWRRDKSGNLFRYEGLAHFGNATQPFYDVYFLTKR